MFRLLIFLLPVSWSGCSTPETFQIPERYNRAWETATVPYPGRYAGLNAGDMHRVRHKELRFAQLLDSLTAVDGCSDLHGCFHIQKDEQEAKLWILLEKLPNYPGKANLLLAAIDDVYLGYHWNGYRGYDWHWPYFNCLKAVTLAERLAVHHPDLEAETLWILIYCYRVLGLKEAKGYEGQGGDSNAARAQMEWKFSPAKVRELCKTSLEKFPNSPYVDRLKRLLTLDDDHLSIFLSTSVPYGPRPMGRRELGESGMSLYGMIDRLR